MPGDIISFGAELDPRKLEQGVNRANAKLGQLDQAAKRTGGALTKLGTVAAAVVTVATIRRVATLGTELFKLGAAANATASRFRTVFGESTKAVEDFNREFGKISGLSTQQFQDISARLGAIAQGMGFAQNASADFALELVKLSADLASFNDLPVDDVAHRIAAALTGERESLKRLGVVITEVEVQQTALANTGKKTATALTQQEKATATLELITQKAGVAVGDLGRTSQEIDNVVRQLSAAWRDFNDRLGTFIAQSPLVRDFLARVRDTIRSVTTILGGETEDIRRAFELLGIIAGDAFVAALLKSLVTIPQKFAIINTVLKDKLGFGLPGFELANLAADLGIDALINSADAAVDELSAMADAISENQRRADAARESFQQLLDVSAGFVAGIPIPTPAAAAGIPGAIPRPAPPLGGLRTEGKLTAEEIQLTLDEDAYLAGIRAQEDYQAALDRTNEIVRLHVNTIDSQNRILDDANAKLKSMGDQAERISQSEIDARVRDFIRAGTDILDAADALRAVGIEGEDFDRIMRALAEAMRHAGDETSDLTKVWQTGFRSMSIILSDFITGGIQGFSDLGDAILRMLQRLALEATFESLGKALKLPGFQEGGPIPGPEGKPQLAVVHGGEYVIPIHERKRREAARFDVPSIPDIRVDYGRAPQLQMPDLPRLQVEPPQFDRLAVDYGKPPELKAPKLGDLSVEAGKLAIDAPKFEDLFVRYGEPPALKAPELGAVGVEYGKPPDVNTVLSTPDALSVEYGTPPELSVPELAALTVDYGKAPDISFDKLSVDYGRPPRTEFGELPEVKFGKLPKFEIPGFQTGGIVAGPLGQPQLAVVHGGEEIVPVSERHGQGVNVNQNINFNISALDAPSVARMLTQQKGTITAVVAEAINDSDTIRRLITRR